MSITESPAANHPPQKPAPAATIRYQTRGRRLQWRSSAGFEWIDAHLPIPNLPAALENFRILHLSDLHARADWDPAYDDLISRVAQNPPDLILFTGDFVDYRFDFRIGWPTAEKLLRGLKSRLGIVGILGNHDGDLLTANLAALNITLIDQRRLIIQAADAAIELIGFAGVHRVDLDLPMLESIGERPPSSVRIALSHYPDTILKTKFLQPDLYLSGHTHGGQICLPGRFPILRHDTLPRKYCSGIHRAFDTWHITSRGFGFSSMVPLRVFCPAEVVEMTLTK